MPVTIKVDQIKYKNDQGQYVGINGVAEQSTQEELAAIETAKNIANTDIANKAAQARASIPSDYTALSDEVMDLKSAIGEIDNYFDDTFDMPQSALTFDNDHYCNVSSVSIDTYYDDGFSFSPNGELRNVMFVFPTVAGEKYKVSFNVTAGELYGGGIKNNPTPGTKPTYVPTGSYLVKFSNGNAFTATSTESLIIFAVMGDVSTFTVREVSCKLYDKTLVLKKEALPENYDNIIDGLKKDIGESIVLVNGSSSFMIENKAINQDGSVVDENLYNLTDYIPLKGCTSLRFGLSEYYSLVENTLVKHNTLSFYDSNKDFIGYSPSKATDFIESICGVPANAEYVVGAFLSISSRTPYIIGIYDNEHEEKIDGLLANDELNGTPTLTIVNPTMTIYDFVNAINAQWTTYATLNRCRPWSFMYLKPASTSGKITIADYENFCEILNKNFRMEVASPKFSYAKNCNRINNAFSKKIYRYVDAKLNTTSNIDFSVKTPLVDKSEPSVIVSDDLSTMYVYAFMNRTETKDGAKWSTPIPLHYDGDLLIHANISKIEDIYYMTGTNGSNNKLFSMKTSSDGIDFTTIGNLFVLNYEIESGKPVIAYGNSTITRDCGSKVFYLYVEYLTDINEGWKIALFTGSNPSQVNQDGTVGDWVSVNGNPVIKQVWLNLDGTDEVGACNPDFIKGCDNRPLKHNNKYYMFIHSVHNHLSYNVNGTANLIRLVSEDLVNWSTDGIFLDNRDVPQQGDDTCGNSDACIIEFKGRTYLFYSKDVNNTQQSTIHETVVYMVDDRPLEEMLKIRP